jgi:hypothetical protein
MRDWTGLLRTPSCLAALCPATAEAFTARSFSTGAETTVRFSLSEILLHGSETAGRRFDRCMPVVPAWSPQDSKARRQRRTKEGCWFLRLSEAEAESSRITCCDALRCMSPAFGRGQTQCPYRSAMRAVVLQPVPRGMAEDINMSAADITRAGRGLKWRGAGGEEHVERAMEVARGEVHGLAVTPRERCYTHRGEFVCEA